MTSSNTRAVKRGQRSGHSTLTSAPASAPARAGVLAPRRRRERRAGGRVQLARDAVDAEAVGPVGGDLELEHLGRRSAAPPPAACRARARRRASSSSSTRMPVVRRRRSRARSRRGSSLRRATPRSFACSSFVPSGITRARARDGDRLAGGDVRRAADDRRGPVRRPEVDLADLQPVGVGVLLGLEHAPDDEALGRRARRGGGSPRPSCRSSSGAPRSPRRRGRVAVFAQPRQRHPHPNCSRKRRSFS